MGFLLVPLLVNSLFAPQGVGHLFRGAKVPWPHVLVVHLTDPFGADSGQPSKGFGRGSHSFGDKYAKVQRLRMWLAVLNNPGASSLS